MMSVPKWLACGCRIMYLTYVNYYNFGTQVDVLLFWLEFSTKFTIPLYVWLHNRPIVCI